MNTTTTKKRPVGRPRADGKAPLTREAVFAVAAKLIATHGYVGTSLRMIAEPLDARAPSISRMFGSKRHLLIELVKSLSCLLYTSPSPRDRTRSRMPSSA